MDIQQYIQDCIGRNDYNSVAATCRELAKANPQQAKKLYELSDTYEKYGGMCSAVLNTAGNDREKELLSFALQNQFGINTSNIAKSYMDNLNTTADGKTIGAVEYTFQDNAYHPYGVKGKSSEEIYNVFCDNLGFRFGYKSDQTDETPYIYNDDKGNVVLHVPNSFYKNTQMFSKLNNALIDDNMQPAYGGIGFGATRASNVFYQMLDIEGNPIDKGFDFGMTTQPIDKAIPRSHQKALEYANQAQEVLNTKYNELFSKAGAAEIMDYGYINDDARRIHRMAMSHQIKEEDADRYLKRIQNWYDGKLKRVGLTNYEIYATDINGETLNFMKIDDNDSSKKAKYSQMLAEAMKEGRVSYSAASSAGRVGTLITISGMSDKEGEEIGNRKGDIRMFVPGLFQEGAQEMIDSDPDAKAVNEYYEHMIYKHQYTLADGGRLTNFVNEGDQNGAFYTDVYGNKEFKSEADVKVMIRDNELIKASYRRLQEEFAEDLSTKNYNEYRDSIEETANQYARNLYFYVNGINDSATQEELLKSNKVNSEIRSIVDTILQNVINNN